MGKEVGKRMNEWVVYIFLIMIITRNARCNGQLQKGEVRYSQGVLLQQGSSIQM